MINIQEFLLKNVKNNDVYALVKYDNKVHAIHFAKHNYKGEYWFLESPCQLYKHAKVDCDIDIFCKMYVKERLILEENADIDEYINNFVKPMIIDNWLYEIVNYQCAPFLPKIVDEIEIISEKKCLEYILKNNS